MEKQIRVLMTRIVKNKKGNFLNIVAEDGVYNVKIDIGQEEED